MEGDLREHGSEQGNKAGKRRKPIKEAFKLLSTAGTFHWVSAGRAPQGCHPKERELEYPQSGQPCLQAGARRDV